MIEVWGSEAWLLCAMPPPAALLFCHPQQLVARFAAARTGAVVISIDPALSVKAVKWVQIARP
jgi:hypothetical protein